MVYKAALASTDGKVVNQHFGRARRFLIVEIAGGDYSFSESRDVTPPCENARHEHDGFDAVLDVLSGVQAIIVSKIGAGALNYLESAGLAVYEAPYPIEPLLRKIIRDKLYETDNWGRREKNG